MKITNCIASGGRRLREEGGSFPLPQGSPPIRLNFDFQSRGETETTEGVRIHIYIYVYLSIVMHRRAGYATVAVSRKERGWRRALGFSFRVQLYRAREGEGEGLNMHDAWALKPAFLRVVHHPRAPRMQIAGHRRYRFRHLERRSLPIPAKLRAREFFSLIFLPLLFFHSFFFF